MSARIITFLILMAGASTLFAEEDVAPSPTPRPSILHRIVNVFHKDKKAPQNPKDKDKKLVLELDFTPDPVKLSDGSKIQVTVRLINKTGKFTQLEFPTTQRIEVLLRNQAGKMVTQWSEEQSFSNDAGYVTIDPGEHVEYSVSISGRDLVAGKTYTIEAFFPNYENLRVTKDFVPQH